MNPNELISDRGIPESTVRIWFDGQAVVEAVQLITEQQTHTCEVCDGRQHPDPDDPPHAILHLPLGHGRALFRTLQAGITALELDQ